MMKKITLYVVLFTAGFMIFSACTKEYDRKIAATQSTEGTAYLRFIHAAPFFRQVFNAPDSFHVFVNGNKVNGTVLTYGSVFPAAATGNAYISIPPGAQQIKFSSAGMVNADSIQITNFTNTLSAGESYTVLITDSARITLSDAYTKPSPGNYNLRFINLVLNDTAGKVVDIFSVRANAVLYNNIKPGITPTAFKTLPVTTVNDTLYVRRSGTAINLAVLNNLAFANQRAYTLYYKGNGSLTTGPKARSIATYTHP